MRLSLEFWRIQLRRLLNLKVRLRRDCHIHVAAHFEFRLLKHDGRKGCNALRKPYAGAHDRVVAHDRLAAKNRGVRIDDDAILEGWMPLASANQVAVAVGREA